MKIIDYKEINHGFSKLIIKVLNTDLENHEVIESGLFDQDLAEKNPENLFAFVC